MTRINFLMQTPAVLNRCLIGLGTCGLLTTSAYAVPVAPSSTLSHQLSDRPVQLAQAVRNYCRKGESMFLSIETKSYWVNICGGDNPNSYVGVNKKNKQSIRVPLKDFSPQGTFFHAQNKDVSYILAQTPRGKFLTVSQGTRELLREPVLKGW